MPEEDPYDDMEVRAEAMVDMINMVGNGLQKAGNIAMQGANFVLNGAKSCVNYLNPWKK